MTNDSWSAKTAGGALPGPPRGRAAPRRLAVSLVLAAALCGLGMVGRAAAAPPMGVTCGSTISQPGHYFLTGDCTGPGITITASDVKLKLDGHTMTGGGPAAGVDVFGSRVTVEGPGTITAYFQGIYIRPGSSGDKVVGTTTTGNVHGILVEGSGNKVVGNSANGNLTTGILLFTGGATDNKIVANTTDRNGAIGIFLPFPVTTNTIHGNTALGNSSHDLEDDNPGCDSNDWSGNQFATSNNPSCIH